MYELYNKNVKVADISEDDYFLHVVELDLLPFDLRGTKSALRFLSTRVQQTDRKFAADIKMAIEAPSVQQMINKTALASLNDTFWLKEEGKDLSWNDVNLYDEQNRFDHYLFKAALCGLTEEDYDAYMQNEKFAHVVTPEFTTGGSYAKAWYRDDKYGLCLLKAGRSKYKNREVVAEVLGSKVAEQLCSNSVPYHLKRYKDKLYCASEIFTDEDHSFVSFMDYIAYFGRVQKAMETNADYIKNLVSNFDDDNKVNEMLLTDVLLANRDRHYGNFGFLYNPNTMKIESFAPVFDLNQALGFDIDDHSMEGYMKNPRFYLDSKLQIKAGGSIKEIIKNCSTRSLLDKVEACELNIPSSINFDFWTEKRNEMVKRMFDYQKERILANGKFYALERELNSDSDIPSSDCELER